MRFSLEQDIAADPDDVVAAVIDPGFLAHLSDLPKLGAPDLLEQVDDGDVLRQRVRYRFVGDLPSAARRFIDAERLTWVEESALTHSTRTTTFRIVADHYRSLLTCRGTFTVEGPDGGPTRRRAEGDLSVGIPLVGRAAENAIVSGLREHAAEEARVIERWIAGRG